MQSSVTACHILRPPPALASLLLEGRLTCVASIVQRTGTSSLFCEQARNGLLWRAHVLSCICLPALAGQHVPNHSLCLRTHSNVIHPMCHTHYKIYSCTAE